jgi:hypothetical protein
MASSGFPAKPCMQLSTSLTMSMHPISFLLKRSPRCLISSTDHEAAPDAVFATPLLSLLSQIIDNKIREIKYKN